MYSIHTTLGFIIESRPHGEAGRVLSIFTRELGLVRAMAQGIRLEKSKLRYHTVEHSFGTFSFVRGKELWRLISAQGLEAGEDIISVGRVHKLGVRTALLLRRLLQGEESHPQLFDCVLSVNSFLHNNEDLNDEQLRTLESVAVIRILHSLGYVGADIKMGDLFKSDEFSRELLKECALNRILINGHINKALKESQL